MADPESTGEINCPQCGFANAANRTFCQDCGARLTGGSGAPVPSGARPLGEPTAPAAQPSGVRKRQPTKSTIRRGGEKPRPTFFSTLLSFVRIIFYAALIAAIIQIVRAPDPFPEFPAMTPEVSQSMRDRLVAASQGGGGKRIEYPWGLINGYVAERVPPTTAAEEDTVRVEFVRAVLEPAGATVRLHVERRFNGHPLFLSLELRPVSRGNGGTSVRTVGGSLGRLPLPAFLASLFNATAKPVSEGLFYEVEILAEAQSISLSPESATVIFP
jgi:hypothetical protein